VLYLIHGHAQRVAGGAERHALELFRGIRASGSFAPILLARTGDEDRRRSGTPFSVFEPPDQLLLHSSGAPGEWDSFLGQRRDRAIYYRHLHELLVELAPAVVHAQHLNFIGYPFLRQVKSTLPDAALVMTLPEDLPICLHDGQMVTRPAGELCPGADPHRCGRCFPEHGAGAFVLRERFIKAHLRCVDAFVAPSRFLRQRFVEWGIPAAKIVHLDYGRPPMDRLPPRAGDGPRNRFAFFGQLNRFKGLEVLLRALRMIRRRGEGEVELEIHGANLEFERPDFRRRYEALLGDAGPGCTSHGPYRHEQLPSLMRNVDWVVVPSLWWENSPLVIQEAFLNGRPVICSDIGGMAEKVHHGADGLHFRAGDAASLAEVMTHAASTAGLWERLAGNLPAVPTLADAVAGHEALYRSLTPAAAGARPG
jgi:glycosyltransferase involved in cell wall biosynthesis